MNRTEIKRAKKADLEDILKAHGASVDGSRAELAARAEKIMFVNDEPREPVDVQGGAKVESRVMQPVYEDVPDGIRVVTTAPGTLGPGGIVPVGTVVTVSLAQYSPRWMRPADDAASRDLQKLRKMSQERAD